MSKRNTHVYFNKRDKETNMYKYKTGNFVSAKNNSTFVYRSGYEYAYLQKLESDPMVVNYVVEPFNIPYVDDRGKSRTYKPDIVVLRSSGVLEVVEIKPKVMLQNSTVQRKAAAARTFLKRNFKNNTIEYRFITEEDIFDNYQQYLDLLKTI